MYVIKFCSKQNKIKNFLIKLKLEDLFDSIIISSGNLKFFKFN
jgi:hypothetical protein